MYSEHFKRTQQYFLGDPRVQQPTQLGYFPSGQTPIHMKPLTYARPKTSHGYYQGTKQVQKKLRQDRTPRSHTRSQQNTASKSRSTQRRTAGPNSPNSGYAEQILQPQSTSNNPQIMRKSIQEESFRTLLNKIEGIITQLPISSQVLNDTTNHHYHQNQLRTDYTKKTNQPHQVTKSFKKPSKNYPDENHPEMSSNPQRGGLHYHQRTKSEHPIIDKNEGGGGAHVQRSLPINNFGDVIYPRGTVTQDKQKSPSTIQVSTQRSQQKYGNVPQRSVNTSQFSTLNSQATSYKAMVVAHQQAQPQNFMPKIQKAMRKLSFESLQKAAQYSRRVVESNTSREFTLAQGPEVVTVRNPQVSIHEGTSYFRQADPDNHQWCQSPPAPPRGDRLQQQLPQQQWQEESFACRSVEIINTRTVRSKDVVFEVHQYQHDDSEQTNHGEDGHQSQAQLMISVPRGEDQTPEPIADIVSFDRQSARIRAAVNEFITHTARHQRLEKALADVAIRKEPNNFDLPSMGSSFQLETDQGGECTSGSIPSLRDLVGGVAQAVGNYAIGNDERSFQSTFIQDDQSLQSQRGSSGVSFVESTLKHMRKFDIPDDQSSSKEQFGDTMRERMELEDMLGQVKIVLQK